MTGVEKTHYYVGGTTSRSSVRKINVDNGPMRDIWDTKPVKPHDGGTITVGLSGGELKEVSSRTIYRGGTVG